MKAHPLNFLWGDDPDTGRPICWGKDTTDQRHRIKPLPRKKYLRHLVQRWWEQELLVIVKSRQMNVTWTIGIGCHLWLAEMVPHSLIFLQSKKEEDSWDLITRAKFMYNQQPDWLKEVIPLPKRTDLQPKRSLDFCNGSQMVGIPQGAHQVRQFAPSAFYSDEICFQDQVEETIGAVMPAVDQGQSRLTMVSSAYPNPEVEALIEEPRLEDGEPDSPPGISRVKSHMMVS